MMASDQPESPPRPLFRIPFRRDSNFVDRKAVLDQIDRKWTVPGSWIALVGLGGVGKSQVAIEWAYRIRVQSPGTTWIFWVHASNAVRVEESFRNIARRVKMPGWQNPKADIFQLVHDWLRDEKNGKWILILDNVEDLDGIMNGSGDNSSYPFPTYIRECGNGSGLVTTRSADVARRLVDRPQDIIMVGAMVETEAVALLHNKLGQLDSHSNEDLIELALTLDFIPLAMVQAAAYIFHRRPRSSVQSYLQDFRRSHLGATRLLNFSALDVRRDSTVTNSIIKTWRTSFDHIRKIRPSAADLLALMSFYDGRGIPEALIRNHTKKEVAHQGQAERNRDRNGLGDDDNASQSSADKKFKDNINTLWDYSLITVNADGKSFEMLGLVQLATRMWLETRGQLEKWKYQSIRNLYALFEFPAQHDKDWEACRILFPHAKAVARHEPRPDADRAQLEWATILCKAAWYAVEAGNGIDAEEMSVQASSVSKRMFGQEHPDTLCSMDILGFAKRLRGQWEAAEAVQVEVMELKRKVFGVDHPETLTSMDNLASTYEKQEQWEAAKELLVKVIELRKKMLGINHPETLTSMNNLASIYKHEVQGEGGNKDDVLDGISDVSDVPSIFSSNSSIDSFSSAGSYEDARRTATQHLAYILSEDPSLRPLYARAMQEVGRDRFSKNHDRLLKKLFTDLRLESRDRIHLEAVRFLRHRSKREQVTAQICQLSHSQTSAANQRVMQQHLEQEEDRAYHLDRFLGASSGKTIGAITNSSGVGRDLNDVYMIDNVDKVDDEDDEENDQDDEENDQDDEEELDDEIEGGRSESLPHFESIVHFLTKGPAFLAFKLSLNHFINPPSTIEEALSGRNIRGLRQLLKKRFGVVAQGEYFWLHELYDIGYTGDEIADLLFEQAIDAPWIHFEPNTFDSIEAQAGIHLPGCVHQCFSSDHLTTDQSTTTPLHRFPVADWRGMNEIVQELCGLAGITPTSRDLDKWIGSVRFEEQNSVAVVTYSQPSDSSDLDHHTGVSRITSSLDRFCLAAGHVQAAGLCCDSFTILRLPTYNSVQPKTSEPFLEMCRIDFKLVLQLLSEVKTLSVLRNIQPVHTVRIQEIASKILQPIIQEATEAAFLNDVDTVLHYCSLAVQFVCLGFLSYSQGHAGAIRPFYLDTPLRKIQLLGIRACIDEYDWIDASLNSFTCIGDMVQAPVLTFNSVQSRTLSTSPTKPPAYDLLTNAEDLLDTWGPGHFVVPAGTSNLPSAIKLGDGIIFASDLENNKFHWSRTVSSEDLSRGTLNPRSKIIIGAPVIVNETCNVDERKCWTNSSPFLEPLGPYGTHWDLDERQFGIQVGHYALLQAVAASHKLAALTLKQHRLQQEDETLIPFLDNLWGVQVSFCTRVARRVPLREIVADMLSKFAMAFISSRDEELSWEELKTTHDILGAFQQQGIQDWLIKLPPHLYKHVLKMIRRIFTVLQHTGLDRDGKNLLVAWPYERDIYRCFKIPCEKESSWVGILADSEDCATFAYVSTKCLETTKIKCGGPNAAWQGALPILETAVMLQTTGPARLTNSLQHNATHFFQKLDNLFFVRVERPDATGTARLITTRSSSPMVFQRRLFVKLMDDRKRLSRLREKIAPDDLAEQVAVSR